MLSATEACCEPWRVVSSSFLACNSRLRSAMWRVVTLFYRLTVVDKSEALSQRLTGRCEFIRHRQPRLAAIIWSCRLALFGLIVRMDDGADDGRILWASLRRTGGGAAGMSLHHVAQHRPTGSETTPPYGPRSSRFGSEPPSVKDDVDVWRYAILELHARNDDDDIAILPIID